jgi:hypothetical protein
MRSAGLFLFVCATALAQDWQPSVTNAQFETRAYSGDLALQLRASAATWFGYAVKSVSYIQDNCCERCKLEPLSKGASSSPRPIHPVALEGTDTIAILFRVENNNIEKIHVNSLNCSLDAGGLPFIWLTGVPETASLTFLERLTLASNSDSMRDGAVFAISQHAGPAAVTLLEGLARPPQPPHVRGQAIFWLAQRAGEKAASFIVGAIENDPDTEVKKKAVFALSQLPRDEGIPKLIEVARQNRNREVQKQAFFWLGQSQDPRALAYIEQVLER